ncbi:hypothetical protein PTE30175_04876 [Pandoraea terrae]|uniref:HNH nuclease domain-containing protein n=1 Tax=Pandoraea terrae TaxID=1537710 RepID=A0A5E4Z1R2_9BURK|nr:HNH endonuclease [Pandoraea terrae]VVE55079.1 hypothetical protein PTE30175_04876 [Pandoraea terrae]
MKKTQILTANDIKRGLVRVAQSDTIFPSDVFGHKRLPREKCIEVNLPNGDSYLTDVLTYPDGRPRFLREGASVRHYLEAIGARAGDVLELTQVDGRSYLLNVLSGRSGTESVFPGEANIPDIPAVATNAIDETPPDLVSLITVNEYADAISEASRVFTAEQYEMLVGHALAPNRTLSMERLAALGGYDGHEAGNSQYGRLGGLIARRLGVSGLANQVYVLCTPSKEKDENGHYQLTLRERVFEALSVLEMLSATPMASDGIQDEQDKSPCDSEQCRNEPLTVRQALIEARLGQGSYRRKMLRWWGGACAVTGCTVEKVLVASHALPWKLATNRQRLDHFNGLPLVATLDKLFDSGFIGFNGEGRMLFSKSLSAQQKADLGLREGMCLRKIEPRIMKYLSRHREMNGLG